MLSAGVFALATRPAFPLEVEFFDKAGADVVGILDSMVFILLTYRDAIVTKPCFYQEDCDYSKNIAINFYSQFSE
jgi:hypothetical protein